ncbi:hypothetical protein HK105_202065 [Polyrhizophydium stewartii]|uniref:Uncharacterized protein n=1 Tax=Polyrhizophydium stewartii TaxID=2732419 RepID=A0ABR4NF31_9FUNG
MTISAAASCLSQLPEQHRPMALSQSSARKSASAVVLASTPAAEMTLARPAIPPQPSPAPKTGAPLITATTSTPMARMSLMEPRFSTQASRDSALLKLKLVLGEVTEFMQSVAQSDKASTDLPPLHPDSLFRK